VISCFSSFLKKDCSAHDSGESWSRQILEERGFIGCFFCI
jgi:hypothetical protein